jgi:hypothetical protein
VVHKWGVQFKGLRFETNRTIADFFAFLHFSIVIIINGSRFLVRTSTAWHLRLLNLFIPEFLNWGSARDRDWKKKSFLNLLAKINRSTEKYHCLLKRALTIIIGLLYLQLTDHANVRCRYNNFYAGVPWDLKIISRVPPGLKDWEKLIYTLGRTPLDKLSARIKGLHLHRTTQHKTRDKHPCFKRDSKSWSRRPSDHGFRHWTCGHWDRICIVTQTQKLLYVSNPKPPHG